MKIYGFDPFKLIIVEAEVQDEDAYWYYLPKKEGMNYGSIIGLGSSVKKEFAHLTPESAIENYYYKIATRKLKQAIKDHATIFALMKEYGLKTKF